MMCIVPIFYVACYLLINLSHIIGLCLLDSCNSVCKLSSHLFMHLGAFLYLTITLLSLYRRKEFFQQFDARLNDIDAVIQKCQRVAEMDKVKVTAVKHSVAYHFTWLFLFCVFTFALYYDVRSLYL